MNTPRSITTENHMTSISAASALTQAFLRNFPRDAARELETMSAEEALDILVSAPSFVRQRVYSLVTGPFAAQILLQANDMTALELLRSLDAGPCAALLSRFDEADRDRYLTLLGREEADELRELMDYPANTAGYMMDARVLCVNQDVTVSDVMGQLKHYAVAMRRRIYTLDDRMRLTGQVELERLVCAEPSQTLAELSSSVLHFVAALAPKEDVADKLQKNVIDILPVVDIHHRLLGVIRGENAIETLKENIAADLQTMVGASRDEQALSSSFFAVRKRQPWLQVNLLTGFLAAAVVGLFESTIAQLTALAVLMPVAAGQSGNTGAQALAVTMRGLTLREITVRDWLKVMLKEASAGFINGIAIAITCGAGVYVWSQSVGLAVVIAIAMIISMTIAGTAGALVPICLKKLGQDPAQSSSIILTTVTDIAGFMSFLGIAALFSRFLT